MPNKIAKYGTIYVCGACGKTSEDLFGMEGKHSHGWDESCSMNAVLCYERKDDTGAWLAVPIEEEKEKPNG